MNTSTTSSSQHPAESATLVEQLHNMRLSEGLSDRSLDVVYAMAYKWLMTGDFDKARAGFEVLFSQRPDVPAYAAGLANAALNQGDADVAMSHFLLAVGMDENNAGYMVGLGRAFRLCNLPGHARMAFQIAQEMGRGTDPATADLARACLVMMGDA